MVVTTRLLTSFEIQLIDTSPSGLDTGVGVDDSTVVPEAVTVLRDGTALTLGVDYRFGYDAASNLIRLTPLSGVWSSNATYRLVLDNQMITDLGGNALRPNQLNGSTELTIVPGWDAITAMPPPPIPCWPSTMVPHTAWSRASTWGPAFRPRVTGNRRAMRREMISMTASTYPISWYRAASRSSP